MAREIIKQVRDRATFRLRQCLQFIGSNLPKHEDTSAIGDMLVGVLNRFARHCADAEDRLEKLRRQNAAQSAEMQELRERVKKLEALLPPTPRLASPPYHDRGPRAPPSTRQMRPPQQSEAPVEAAIIEDGRVVRMRAGERPRELWTACRTGPVSHERAELDRAGLERPYAPAKAPPTPRLRRPPSPKPLPTKNATFPPMDAPPVPTRSITSPDVCYTRHMLRDRKTGFEPREDDVRWVTRAHEIQPLAV